MTKKNQLENGSFSKSLVKTLSILEQYGKGSEYGIIELSQNTGIPPSTVQRIVNTLVLKQFLAQNPENLKYSLGIGFFNISSQYSDSQNWVEQAKSHMEKLVEIHSETVNLAVLVKTKVKYLTKVESPYIVRPNFNVGTSYPAINTALGRCIISHLPEREMKEFIEISISDGYLSDKVNKKELITSLKKIRARGYAVEDEEFQKGLFCVASPVYDRYGNCIAAISTSIPKQRLDFGELPELIEHVKKTAKAITDELRNKFIFSFLKEEIEKDIQKEEDF